MCRDASIVTTGPPVTIKSTCVFDCAGKAVAAAKNKKTRASFFTIGLDANANCEAMSFLRNCIRATLQIRRIEWPRQQFRRALAFDFAFEVRENHGHVTAKFPN